MTLVPKLFANMREIFDTKGKKICDQYECPLCNSPIEYMPTQFECKCASDWIMNAEGGFYRTSITDDLLMKLRKKNKKRGD